MDIKELRNQSPKRLNELLAKTTESVRDLRFTVMTRQQARVRDLRKVRREIAQIKTILKQKREQEHVTKES